MTPLHSVAPSRWFAITAPRRRPRLRLICCSFAGGGASFYRSWPAELADDVEVVALQLPGRENRTGEPPLASLDRIVDTLSRELRPLLDGTPLVLFGHSMGALVAFELARALRRVVPVARLFVSAASGPRLPRRDSPLHPLPDPEFIAELRRLGGTPEAVLENRELMELFLPLLRTDFTACETYVYRPSPPLNCPITAFGGLGDRTVDRSRIQTWAAETSSAFDLRMMPGDHFFISPCRPTVLATIDEALAAIS